MNKKIHVSVSSEVDTFLSTISRDLGMPKSELCSFILSDQVLKFIQTDVGKQFMTDNRDYLINLLQSEFHKISD